MFSERTPNNNEPSLKNDGQSPEKIRRKRQKDGLIGYYLSGGDERYVFEPDEVGFGVDSISLDDQNALLDRMNSGEDFSDLERQLLESIAGPRDLNGSPENIYKEIANDDMKKQILAFSSETSSNSLKGNTVDVFLDKYPTPIDFETTAEKFLELVSNVQPDNLQDYKKMMDDFEYNVYGNKYVYYKLIQELYDEASKIEQKDAEPVHEEGSISWDDLFEMFEKDTLVRDSGLAVRSRGEITGEEGRKNEDSSYYNPKIGLFGVFDGVGGRSGGAKASEKCSEVLGRVASQGKIMMLEKLRKALILANQEVTEDTGAGCSTAVVGSIIERGGEKKLLWASVGDSRIYVVRDGQTRLLTRDEGLGSNIDNALGIGSGFRMKQSGEYSLRSGDRIVFCSDGVTGDYEPDFIPDDEFASIVSGAATAESAAKALIDRATKKDDRTAIVVEV